MQRPWTQFATNYAEKGNQYPHMYPHSPVSKSVPSYNRSPAPFSSVSAQHPPAVHQYHEHNGSHVIAQEPVHQQPQQWEQHVSQAENEHQQQLQYQHYNQLQQANLEQERVKNTREDPDFDEDFPNYNEVRKVFVDKQKVAQKEGRQARSQQRRTAKGIVIGKPPSPHRRPQLQSPKSPRDAVDHSPIYRQQPIATRTVNMMQSPQKPRRIFSQVSHPGTPGDSWRQESITTQRQSMPMSPRRRSNSLGQVYKLKQSGGHYQEIPVHYINNSVIPAWQHIKPTRDAVKYKPPMTVHIPTQVDGSPKVTITSNSPRSPQKATYIPDGDNQNIYHQTGFPTQMSPGNILSMGGNDNQPRRRRSYAEVMITHNSLPRDFTTKHTISQQMSHDGSLMNGTDNTELFPHQRKYNTLGSSRKPSQSHHSTYKSSSSSSSWERGYSAPISYQKPVKIDVRHPSMEQMLYASSTAGSPNTQQQTGSWQYNQQMTGSPRVVQIPSNTHPGKSAAHLQYNSPMGLYSTQNAQQALDKDREAAELLKITGAHGSKQKTAITPSPTLQAVLREDKIKRQTGYKPDVGFYQNHREYGPGYGPLRQYEEVPDTLSQSITSYNQQQDRTLTYPMWSEC